MGYQTTQHSCGELLRRRLSALEQTPFVAGLRYSHALIKRGSLTAVVAGPSAIEALVGLCTANFCACTLALMQFAVERILSEKRRAGPCDYDHDRCTYPVTHLYLSHCHCPDGRLKYHHLRDVFSLLIARGFPRSSRTRDVPSPPVSRQPYWFADASDSW